MICPRRRSSTTKEKPSLERHRTIDTSLRERRSILDLLERLRAGHLSVDELDQIGTRLQKAGRWALSPLVRRLWREQDGDLIARYAYLLDYFPEEPWLDQLVQITLTRKDLGDEGRSALLAALEGYGVDVSSPPFVRLMDEGGGPLRLTLPRLLDKGEKGLIMFMEALVSYDPEAQQALVRDLASVDDPRVADLYAVLLGFDEPETLRAVIECLGRVRDPKAAMLLRRYRETAAEEYRPLVERSLRRLAFLGLDTEAILLEEPSLPFHAAFASPVDGEGMSFVFVARETGADRFDTLCMNLNESDGMREAWGWSEVDPEEYEQILREINVEEGLVPVAPPFAASLVADALHRSVGSGFYLPPEFYVRRRIFRGLDIRPACHIPCFEGIDLETVMESGRIAESAQLLDDPLFDGWFVLGPRAGELAADLDTLDGEPSVPPGGAAMERFLERYCRERLTSELERIVRRLFLAAELMQQEGRERREIEIVLAAALGLSRGVMPSHRHPLLRRWLMELIDLVREAKGEGYAFPLAAGDDEWD